MARFRAKEAAEEDTMRRMVGSSNLQSIEESLAEDFVAGENSGKSSDGGFAKKGNIWKEVDGKTFFRLFRSCDLLTLLACRHYVGRPNFNNAKIRQKHSSTSSIRPT